MSPPSEEDYQRMWDSLGKAGEDYTKLLKELYELRGELKGIIAASHPPASCGLRVEVEKLQSQFASSKAFFGGMIFAGSLLASSVSIGFWRLVLK